MPHRHVPHRSTRRRLPALLGLLALALPAVAAAQAATGEEAVRASLTELDELIAAVDDAHAPFRRGAPADTMSWSRLERLQVALAEVAEGAGRLRRRVDALRATEGFQPAVRPAELRRRLALTDSLSAEARLAAGAAWSEGRPADPEEARAWVAARAHQASRLAGLTAAAAAELAYAVGVTEGVSGRTLNLSLVGLVVVFVVLTLIALVVGLIRRLDDGWQAREEAADAAALVREPTIDQTTVVIIAAACATLITGRHRVRRIRRLLSPHQKRTPWSAQGRLILQGSHTVDRKSN